ncbi:hypothetical protein DFH09DRAFT_1500258 [Mycena vulgaris]|nr:hypothetical protein DFH09DRAFT_1500258 [Mycena vulgaris]
MAELLESPSSMNGIAMCRNDSAESTESPFASVLNTPADEQPLHFEAIDGKLVSGGSQMLERLETRAYDIGHARPHRVSLSRQFAKALDDANKSAAPNVPLFRARSSSVERVYYEPDDLLEPLPSPNLMSFASPELPSEPMEVERVQTPEPLIFDAYNTGSQQTITRTTPRGRPPLRRDMFSLASIPLPVNVADERTPVALDFTPRAHSTLRQRKGMYPDLNDSITGEPAGKVLSEIDLNDVSKDEALDKVVDEALDDCDYYSDGPSLPALSPLLPLQVVLFPAWCVLVGGAILLCPTHLPAIAFPASAFPASAPSHGTALLALAQRILAHCLPFAAPPSAIRTFAHWATVAHLHVAIFLAALVALAYVSPPLGALVAGACAVQFVRAWGDFAGEDGVNGDGVNGDVDADADGDGSTALGGEVRQMLYQVLAPGCGFQDGDALRRVGEKYFLVRVPRVETRAQILAAGGLTEDSDEDDDGDDE